MADMSETVGGCLGMLIVLLLGTVAGATMVALFFKTLKFWGVI